MRTILIALTLALPFAMPAPAFAVSGHQMPPTAVCAMVDGDGAVVASGLCNKVCARFQVEAAETAEQLAAISADGGICGGGAGSGNSNKNPDGAAGK
jgi:hypothetical protein